jgi:hypothetical protein
MFPNEVLPPSSGLKSKPRQAINKKLVSSCCLTDKDQTFEVFVENVL